MYLQILFKRPAAFPPYLHMVAIALFTRTEPVVVRHVFGIAPTMAQAIGFARAQTPEGFVGGRVVSRSTDSAMPFATVVSNADDSVPAPTPIIISDDGGSSSSNAGAFIGGVAVVGGLIWLLSDGGEEGTVSFSPEWNHSITESGYSANVGGRMDFRKDEWTLYSAVSQTNANGDFGDFRYSSGGKWQGDIFAVAFSEKVQGETADYDLSLSADWTGGIWKVSPEFAVDSRYENGEFATTNSFRINGEMRYDDWRFSASGSKTQMELSAVLEF